MATGGHREPRLKQQLRPEFDMGSVSLLCFQASPALICWETLAATTGWGTSTSYSCTTCCLPASHPPPSSRRSPGRCRGSSFVPSVRLYPSSHFTKLTVSISLCVFSFGPTGCTLELLCHNIPPSSCLSSHSRHHHHHPPNCGPTSRRAGLSSSDRTNTILSGKCERTGGDSGPPGEPQAHRSRPLAAYTPSEPSAQHKQETRTRQTHTYTQSPFLARQIASLAQWQLSCTFLSPGSLL